MSTPKEQPITPAWELEFVRLLAFPSDPALYLDQRWWHDLTSKSGEQPEEMVTTRKKLFRDDRGTFQGVLLSLTVDLNRIVWEARSPATVDQAGNFPTLGGPPREKVAWFSELLNPWLATASPPLVRLAFSAKLLHPASHAMEAYAVLKLHLPDVNLLDSNPNDFVLQVNRRKDHSDVVSGLPINRVSTWSKLNVAIFTEPGKPFTKWPDRCYSAVELDINTAPEKTALLPRDSLVLLFQELLDLGVGIAERRDRP